MWISDTSIRRPVATIILMAALVFFGWVGFSRMGIDAFPEVEFPTVNVRTILTGAGPEVIDQDVTDVLEEEIKTIAGIRTLTSRSYEGLSLVTVEFELEKDIDVAAEEVRSKVNVARESLPDDIEDPIVEKFNLANFPIMWLSVAGTVDYSRLSFYADKVVKERLQSVPGVGNIWLGGLREREIRVWLDPTKLEARGLTATDVVAAIRAKHVELPGGRIESPTRELSVKVEGEYASVSELEGLVVAERDGALVTLRDVGRVDDGFQDLRIVARYNGLPTIGLGVRKQSGANTVAVAEAVLAELGEIRRTAPPGVAVDVAFDSSQFVKDSMAGVQHDIVFGILLTALLMYLFLRNYRTTIVSVITIPISLIGGFIVMNALGFTINNMSMLAVSLAVGLVIDDAIVVMENIFRHVENGEAPREAARRGASEVGFAVIAATSSIVAVFLPVAFMEGLIGRFFYQFGMTVALTIVCSVLVALTLTPFMSSRMLRHERSHTAFYNALERFFTGLEAGYRRTLDWAVHHRRAVVAIAVLAFGSGMAMVPFLGSEFMTPADESFFMVQFEMPTGTSLEQTDLRLHELEKALYALPEVSGAFAAVGLNDGAEVNRGLMFVNLVPKSERDRTQFEVSAAYREVLASYSDMKGSIQTWNVFGGGEGRDVTYVLQGPSTAELARVSDAIAEDLESQGTFVDVDTDLRLDKPEVKVRINRNLANDLGVDVRSISSEIYTLFGGVTAAKFKDGGYRYDIRVRALPEFRADPRSLGEISVRGRDGRLIKSPNLVDYAIETGPSSVNRFDRRRAATLYANVAGIDAGEGLRRVAATVDMHLPKDGRWSTTLTGTSQQQQESFASLTFALGLAVVVIYMILAVQFESFVHPLTVMVSLPFCMVGVFGGLLLTGTTLNIFSFLGIIMLMGIVTKNAILLIDFANREREKGVDKVRSMLTAGPIRLRPILMTATATIIGIVPVALALSEGGESRAPLAIAVIGGAFTSTALTLLVIPVIYLMFDDAVEWFGMRVLRRAPRAPEDRAPVPAPAASRTGESEVVPS